MAVPSSSMSGGSSHHALVLGSDSVEAAGQRKIATTHLTSFGHDTINVGSGSDTIHQEGTAASYGTSGFPSFGATSLVGGGHSSDSSGEVALTGKMTLIGSAAAMDFVGGASAELKANLGSDTFMGGVGSKADPTLFESLSKGQAGQYVITNFVAGQNQLHIEGSQSYFQKAGEVTTHGSSTYISFDGGKTTVELHGVGIKSTDITHKS